MPGEGEMTSELPCAGERAFSYKCLEKYQLKKLEPDCQEAFDAYKLCKKKFLDKRNKKQPKASRYDNLDED